MAAYRRGFMTHVTCGLTAKNQDQLRNPTIGNRVWATFTFYTFSSCTRVRGRTIETLLSLQPMRRPIGNNRDDVTEGPACGQQHPGVTQPAPRSDRCETKALRSPHNEDCQTFRISPLMFKTTIRRPDEEGYSGVGANIATV